MSLDKQNDKQYLRDFTKSSSFFSEVDYNTAPSVLSFLHSFLNAENYCDHRRSESTGIHTAFGHSQYGLQVQMSEPKTSLPLHYILVSFSENSILVVLVSHLVVNTESKFLARVGHFRRVSEAVDRQATNRW